MQSSTSATSYCQHFFPTSIIELDKPCRSIKEVDLNKKDILTQNEFKDLVEDNYKHKLGYIIAIAKDALQCLEIYDGCSYIRNWYVHGNVTSALNRASITDVFFYRLSPHKDLFTVDKPTGSDENEIEEEREKNDPVPSLKFNYLCTDKDLDEWFLSFIAAHDPDMNDASAGETGRAAEQSKIGALYESPEKMLNKENNRVSAYTRTFFKKNLEEAFYWYQRAAEDNNPEACSRLAYFYDRALACTASPQTAFAYAKKAYEISPDPLRTKILALRYLKGLGTEVNEEEAERLIECYNNLLATGSTNALWPHS